MGYILAGARKIRTKRARKGLARRAAPFQSPYTRGDSSRLRITTSCAICTRNFIRKDGGGDGEALYADLIPTRELVMHSALHLRRAGCIHTSPPPLPPSGAQRRWLASKVELD
jgi:hypothetical protein